MKGNITFDLPEENSEMQAALAAPHAWNALCDILNELRQHEKHDVPINTTIERIRTRISDALEARGGH